MYVTGAKEKKTVETAEEIFSLNNRVSIHFLTGLAGLSRQCPRPNRVAGRRAPIR
jgi:hypothetical protein